MFSNRRGVPCAWVVVTNFITAHEDTDVACDSLVQPVLLTTQADLDGLLGNLELLGTYSSMVVDHAQAVVAVGHRGSLDRAACRDAGPALHHLLLALEAGLQPIAGARRRGEQAHMAGDRGLSVPGGDGGSCTGAQRGPGRGEGEAPESPDEAQGGGGCHCGRGTRWAA
jgi:hypothetical protein